MQNLAHNLQPCWNLPCEEQQVGDVESNVSCSGYVIAFGHQRDHGTCSSPKSHNGCSSIQVKTREQLTCSTSQHALDVSCCALAVRQLLIHRCACRHVLLESNSLSAQSEVAAQLQMVRRTISCCKVPDRRYVFDRTCNCCCCT